MIALLKQASPEFRDWWQRHEVVSPLSGIKRINHPVKGRMSFEHTGLTLTSRPEMKLIVYTPLDDDETTRKLTELLTL